jgi:hypothetical protein
MSCDVRFPHRAGVDQSAEQFGESGKLLKARVCLSTPVQDVPSNAGAALVSTVATPAPSWAISMRNWGASRNFQISGNAKGIFG